MVLFPPGHKTTARFPASASGVQTAPPPASPASRASRYNTLHLASKVVCQRVPLWKPGFVGVWPQIAFPRLCPHPSKTQRSGAHQPVGWADVCRFFVRPVGRDEGQNALRKLYFRVAIFDNLGYNKLNPNRRLQYERSG